MLIYPVLSVQNTPLSVHDDLISSFSHHGLLSLISNPHFPEKYLLSAIILLITLSLQFPQKPFPPPRYAYDPANHAQ